MTNRPHDDATHGEGRFDAGPDAEGHFGPYGGSFIPETLSRALAELIAAYAEARADDRFWAELDRLGRDYVGRPTPLYRAQRLQAAWGGPEVWLKREDLAHTGAHKINNALGQALLARRMGKERIIAETGAGQHGVATATACALLGLACRVYMGADDMVRQELNVFRMRLLGAEVEAVQAGSRTLKDAINEAMRDWVTTVESTHYILGSVLGPHPFPMMVRDFQAVIGREARAQILERCGRLPDLLLACVGGGSNAPGLIHPFPPQAGGRIRGVEAGGEGIDTGRHAARFSGRDAAAGVLHGTRTWILQDADGQVRSTHSISAGLDYPAVGPEHAWLRDQGRIEYLNVTDGEALEAFEALARLEGIIPALETAHALAAHRKLAACLPPGDLVLINLSGRGDKDVNVAAERIRARSSAG